MKPTCKLCGKAHWSYEDHYTGNSAINPDYVREMAAGAMGIREETAVEVAIESYAPALEELEEIEQVITSTTPPVATVTQKEPVTQKTCNACNKPLHNRGKVCNACRQRAYRERSQ